jgi:hypothetical protein
MKNFFWRKNMKKLLSILLPLISILVLGACSSQEGNQGDHGNGHGGEGELTAISADLNVPAQAEAGETVQFLTHVTQGDENITEATKVEYEVWKEGQKEQSEMIESEHQSNGEYTAEKTFEEDGIYHVQVHVTANDMHTMPKKQITVGNAEAAHESHSAEEGDHDHGHDEVSIQLMKPESVTVGTETELTAHLAKGGESLTDVDVRFEIWLDGSEKHEWVETDDSKEGSYSGSFTFSQAGLYYITVHVENDEGLHEHKEEELTVE